MKNSQKIKIKRAGLADIGSFMVVFQKSLKEQFPDYSLRARNLFLRKHFTKKSFIEDLKGKRMDILLACLDREIVGFLVFLSPYGGVSYISWIAVSPGFQGKGIGTALLRECQKAAKEKGAHKLHLWTSKRNVKFYQKNKWILAGSIPDNYFGAEDWLFYKSIAKPKY